MYYSTSRRLKVDEVFRVAAETRVRSGLAALRERLGQVAERSRIGALGGRGALLRDVADGSRSGSAETKY